MASIHPSCKHVLVWARQGVGPTLPFPDVSLNWCTAMKYSTQHEMTTLTINTCLADLWEPTVISLICAGCLLYSWVTLAYLTQRLSYTTQRIRCSMNAQTVIWAPENTEWLRFHSSHLHTPIIANANANKQATISWRASKWHIYTDFELIHSSDVHIVFCRHWLVPSVQTFRSANIYKNTHFLFTFTHESSSSSWFCRYGIIFYMHHQCTPVHRGLCTDTPITRSNGTISLLTPCKDRWRSPFIGQQNLHVWCMFFTSHLYYKTLGGCLLCYESIGR